MRNAKLAFRIVVGCCSAAAWFVVTFWLGVQALWRTGVLLSRVQSVLARHLFCARGHATPAYGVYECRCGALVEDWVFARCRVCRQSAGWTPCTTCGLPIKNPLLV